MKVKLTPRRSYIEAPREMVFQMLTSFGKGGLPGSEGDTSKVLERDGDTVVVEFLTSSGRRTYRTVERVQLFPPERVTFEHLEGPLWSAQEEFSLAEEASGTDMHYQGDFEYKVQGMPGIGWLIAVIYIKRKYDAVIRDHMDRLKSAAEAHAARSHVFRGTSKA